MTIAKESADRRLENQSAELPFPKTSRACYPRISSSYLEFPP